MPDYIAETRPEIVKLIERRDWGALSNSLTGWADPEVADLFDALETHERILLFRALPRRRQADIFAHMDPRHQDALLQEMTGGDTRRILAALSPDDRTALLAELPASVTQRVMQLLSPEDLAEARQLLGYPEDSVGRLMTPDFLSLKPEMSCGEALLRIRQHGRDSETLNLLYVVDDDGKLLDSIRLRRIILADPAKPIRDMMQGRSVSLSAFDDREQAVEAIQRYDLNALPVLDSEGVMLGIVTVDDIFDVAQEEATEDIHKGAAVEPLDMRYSDAGPTFLYRKRIGWLVILIFVNLLSAGIIANYEEYLMEYIVLAFFLPLLIASGGNTGAQSATLIVRAIATGDLRFSRWLFALGKELLVGSLLGLTMGVLTYALGIYRGGMAVGLTVGLSMVGIVLVANLLGVIMPLTLSRFKLDPAVASSPLITSMMDAVGLIIYFSIAAAVLGEIG